MTQQSCLQQSIPHCLNFSIPLEGLNLICYSSMNLRRLETLKIHFSKSFCKHLCILSFINYVILDLMNQIFILNIYHCFETRHFRSRMFSAVIVNKKINNRFSKYFFSFWRCFPFSWKFEHFNWMPLLPFRWWGF